MKNGLAIKLLHNKVLNFANIVKDALIRPKFIHTPFMDNLQLQIDCGEHLNIKHYTLRPENLSAF